MDKNLISISFGEYSPKTRVLTGEGINQARRLADSIKGLTHNDPKHYRSSVRYFASPDPAGKPFLQALAYCLGVREKMHPERLAYFGTNSPEPISLNNQVSILEAIEKYPFLSTVIIVAEPEVAQRFANVYLERWSLPLETIPFREASGVYIGWYLAQREKKTVSGLIKKP